MIYMGLGVDFALHIQNQILSNLDYSDFLQKERGGEKKNT